jgi:hypothetical protein
MDTWKHEGVETDFTNSTKWMPTAVACWPMADGPATSGGKQILFAGDQGGNLRRFVLEPGWQMQKVVKDGIQQRGRSSTGGVPIFRPPEHVSCEEVGWPKPVSSGSSGRAGGPRQQPVHRDWITKIGTYKYAFLLVFKLR